MDSNTGCLSANNTRTHTTLLYIATMDFVTVTGGIGAANNALSLVKNIAEGIRASGKTEALSQVLDLQMALMELLQKHQATLNG